MREMLARLLGAVQFLTVLPVTGHAAEPGRAAVFFPLVGAWLGWMGATALLLLRDLWPPQLVSLLVVAFGMTITGCLHEDGLADVADAFRAGRPPERIHAILKDSRVGTYGAAALILSVLVRWQAVANISEAVTVRMAAAAALSRTAMVALAWVSRPAGGGLGARFLQSLTTPAALFAIVQGVAVSLLCGPRMASVLVASNILLLLAARAYFHRRIGGITGDCLGAVCQLSEICSLCWMTCLNCSW